MSPEASHDVDVDRSADVSPRPLVICALAFEAASLRREGIARWCDIAVCGPGPDGVRRWASQKGDDARLIMLAGVAGSLHADWPIGRAAWAARIHSEDGRTWTPPASSGTGDGDANANVEILTTARPVCTRSEREKWGAKSGAMLVDLESASFADIASRRGWNWTVVRGVSDDLETSFPIEASDWVDEHGRTRLAAVLRAMACRPSILREVIRLGRNGRLAMREVATLIRDRVRRCTEN